MQAPIKKISFVVAMSENGVIGDNNQLLWHLPNDLKHFKALTLGKPVIMGRKTYESIGKPLVQRQNIVLTQNRDWSAPGCEVVHSVEEALTKAWQSEEMMVIGGGEIYRQFFPLASCLYITYVHAQFAGQTHFVKFDLKDWHEVSREFHLKDEKHLYDYSFVTLERRITQAVGK